MFERVLSNLLNKYLAQYVQNLDTDSLDVSIWSGSIELYDLNVRPDALAQLNVPLVVRTGVLEYVSLHVPWASLWSRPLTLQVRGVMLLVTPLTPVTTEATKEATATIVRAFHRAAKQSLLSQLSAVRCTTSVSQDVDEQAGFFERLATSLLRNIQVSVSDVHVRFEDSTESTTEAAVCGVCVKNISAETTDSKWNPAYSEDQEAILYKLVRLGEVSVYWVPCSDKTHSVTQEPSTEWLQGMHVHLHADMDSDKDYLLRPVSARLRTTIQPATNDVTPDFTADALIDDVTLQLARHQYVSAIYTVANVQRLSINSYYFKHRPDVPLRTHPVAWWRYAYAAVLDDHVRPFSWSSIKHYREVFRRYGEVYLGMVQSEDVSDALNSELQHLEDQLNVTSILIARQLAKIKLAKDREEDGVSSDSSEAHSSSTSSAGWFSWLLAPRDEHVTGTRSPRIWTMLTDQEKRALYEATALMQAAPSEPVEQHATMSHAQIKHRVNVTLSSVTASLTSRGRDILRMSLTSLIGGIETMYNTSLRLSLSLQTMSLDGATIDQDSLAPLVRVVDLHDTERSPVVRVVCETNRDEADYWLDVRVTYIELVYSEHAVSELMSFVQTSQMSLAAAARATSDSVRRLTATGRRFVQHALVTSHRRLAVTADVSSPYLVLPLSGCLQTGGSVLVIDFGRVVIHTQLATDNSSSTDTTTADHHTEQAHHDAYDSYFIELTNIQVLLTESGDEWRTGMLLADSDNHLLAKYALKVVFRNSLPSDSDVTARQRLEVISGALRLSVSERRVQQLVSFWCRLPLTRPIAHRHVSSGLSHSQLDPCHSVQVVNDMTTHDSSVYSELSEKRSASQQAEDNNHVSLDDDTCNIWLPKPLASVEPVDLPKESTNVMTGPCPPSEPLQSLTVQIEEIKITFERYPSVPILALHSGLDVELFDWSATPYLKGELRLQVSTFSEDIGVWEPVLEPVMEHEECYRLYEVLFKIYRDETQTSAADQPVCPADVLDGVAQNECDKACSSADSSDSDESTRLVRAPRGNPNSCRRRILYEPVDEEPCDQSSEESDDDLFDRITSAFHELLSDGDLSGGTSSAEEDNDAEKSNENVQHLHSSDETDGGTLKVARANKSVSMATYILVDSRDRLEFTLTPVNLRVINEILSWSHSGDAGAHFNELLHGQRTTSCLSVVNRLGDKFKVDLLGDSESTSISAATADCTSNLYDVMPDNRKNECLARSILSPNDLHDSVFKHQLRVQSEDFAAVTCWLPLTGRCRRVLLRRTSGTSGDGGVQPAFLGRQQDPSSDVGHYHMCVTLTNQGCRRLVTVSSPLQVVNDLSVSVALFAQQNDDFVVGDSARHLSMDSHIKQQLLVELPPGENFIVPLLTAYHCRLLVQPVNTGHHIGDDAITWQHMVQNKRAFVNCRPTDDTSPVHCIQVVAESGHTSRPHQDTPPHRIHDDGEDTGEDGQVSSMPTMTLRLSAAVLLDNLLPTVLLLDGRTVLPGGSLHVTSCDPRLGQQLAVQLPEYRGGGWSGRVSVHERLADTRLVLRQSETASLQRTARVWLLLRRVDARQFRLTLSVDCWVINRTQLALQLKCVGSTQVYDISSVDSADDDGCMSLGHVTLVSWRSRDSCEGQVSCRLLESEAGAWSRQFDTTNVGSATVFTCRHPQTHQRYRLMAVVQAAPVPHHCPLLIMHALFIIHNNTTTQLAVLEDNSGVDLWHDIAAGQTLNYWPLTGSPRVSVRLSDSQSVSKRFSITTTQRTVLRLSAHKSVVVCVTGGLQRPFNIVFQSYTVGDAPALLLNFSNSLTFRFNQISCGQVKFVSPLHSLLYAWDDPCSLRRLMWNCLHSNEADFEANIETDASGSVQVSRVVSGGGVARLARATRKLQDWLRVTSRHHGPPPPPAQTPRDNKHQSGQVVVMVYWACVCLPTTCSLIRDAVDCATIDASGNWQRCFVVSDDERHVQLATLLARPPPPTTHVFVSMRHVGLSLISGEREEVLYASVESAPAVWHVNVDGRWKALNLEMSCWLEDQQMSGASEAALKNYLQVDLENMQMTLPFHGRLRRHFSPAVWLHACQSARETSLQLQIFRPQLDCQLSGAVYPVVACRVVAPQSRAARAAPLLHVNTTWRGDLTSRSVRRLEVVVQEFALMLDASLIVSLVNMFSTQAGTAPNSPDNVQRSAFMRQFLEAASGSNIGPSLDRNNSEMMLEFVHLSPLKIDLSLSPRGNFSSSPSFYTDSQWSRYLVAILVEVLAAPLTEVTSVDLRLGFFERRNIKVSAETVSQEVIDHYKYQILQQIYVLIFGLDMIGNPYGLVQDFAQGTKQFFYEPYLAALGDNGAVPAAALRGVRSLFGHVLGGTAHSVSLATETAANMFAVLSFDEDYKKKRRMRYNRPGGLPVALKHAAQALVTSVLLSISGLVYLPFRGACHDGVVGFFTGVGRGLVGLLAKPAAGVFDAVAMTLDGVARAALLGQHVSRARLPRFISPYQGIGAFSPLAARGQFLLRSVAVGREFRHDSYLAHAVLVASDSTASQARRQRADVCIVTDRHVLVVGRGGMWRDYTVRWYVATAALASAPHIVADDTLQLRVEKTGCFSWLTGKIHWIHCADRALLEWLARQIECSMLLAAAAHS